MKWIEFAMLLIVLVFAVLSVLFKHFKTNAEY